MNLPFADLDGCKCDGQTIVENGNHDELMSIEDGMYKKMFDMQGSYYK